jgi:Periplasmic component of the Tol biopolymer transport system
MNYLKWITIPFLLLCNHSVFSQATLFEPGLFPTNEAFGLTISPDENELLFVHSFGGRDSLRLMYARKRNGAWQKPVPAPFIKNKFNIIDPFFTPDGKLLLYNSNEPVKNKKRKGFDIYAVAKTKNGWGEPYSLGDIINNDSSDFFATISKRGTLFFASRRAETLGGNDIFYSKLEKGTYKKVEQAGADINTKYSDSNPFISPKEDFLIFFSSRPGGAGDADLYISFKQDGKWLNAINLGPLVNTEEGEFCPFMDGKQNYFYFSRNKQNGKKIIENIFRIPVKDLKLDELKKQAMKLSGR